MARLAPFSRAILLLAGCAFLRLAIPGAAIAADPNVRVDGLRRPPVPLTRIADVKAWADLADQAMPVALDGVVTCAAPAGNFFLHDGTMGIHIGLSDVGKSLQPGDRVRVTGATRRGAFAPSIEPREVTLLGKGTLPSPVRAAWSEVAAGTLDGQWLELEGVVADVEFEAATLGSVLHLAVEGRRLRATVHYTEGVEPDRLIDAVVRVRGVASGSFNRQRQLVEPELRVPGMPFVAIVRPPPADAFGVAAVPLERLLGFSLAAPSPHRVRIRGTVTRAISDRVLFVREGNLGLRIETRTPVRFSPGDGIDAVGFPAMSGGSAVLENAIVRAAASGAAPAPVRTEAARLLDGRHSADLVTVPARLVDRVMAGDTATLILQAGTQLLRATMPGLDASSALPDRNSIVEVTGICVLSDTEEAPADSVRSVMLLLSGPADLVVLQRPDWWTPERLWRALAAVAGLLLLGLGWVWLLRRQVSRKRTIIEQQARHAAVLEERSRIARDLHDTLEQELTGLSLQLKVAEMDCEQSPEQVRGELEAARHILRRSRALAHNAIRELRTDEVAWRHEPLVAGLHRLAETWRHSGIEGVAVSVEGSAGPLPVAVERELLFIAAEAVTNAIKHGHAAEIRVAVHYRAGGVRLVVSDDGSGFDPARAPAAAAGSFGLVGMRERAESMGGRFAVTSHSGSGTIVTVDVPVASLAGDSAVGTAESSGTKPVAP